MAPDGGERYWRSLDELANTPEFRAIANEVFPGGEWEGLSTSSRRQFLKVMGASLALAGVTGCRWPKETIVPYANRPEGRTPGVTERYATAMEIGGVATGLLVTSYDGRPIKIEGNPQHPFSLGATSAIHQASLLELYDPDRSRTVIRREGGQEIPQTWDDFAAFARTHFADLRKKGGKGLAILSEATSSPSIADLRARLAKAMPEAKWYEYEPISADNERAGAKLALSKAYRTHLALDKASVIVCLDADLLMTHPAALRYAHDFVKGRRSDGGTMNRLYVIESGYSMTGSVADHRLAVSAREVGALTTCLGAMAETIVPASNSDWKNLERVLSTQEAARSFSPDTMRFLSAAARDLSQSQGRGIMAAGPRLTDWEHFICHRTNASLGNVGKTVTYTLDPDQERAWHVEAIGALTRQMGEGRVETLLILGGNPAFDAPVDMQFAACLNKVKTSIYLNLFDNETSQLSKWHVPRAHYLESWSDGRAYDGTLSIVQPLIDPLYGGKTSAELLEMVLEDRSGSAYSIVRRTFDRIVGARDSERAWRQALHDGVVPDTRWPESRPRFDFHVVRNMLDSTNVRQLAGVRDGTGSSPEIVFCQEPGLYDGRFANNAWLQEWPDPMTKLTWDNAAVMSPATARSIGVEKGDQVRLTVRGRSQVLPVYVMPGHADGSISVNLGYGRRRAGRVGNGVGVDVYPLRTSTAMGFDTDVKVEKVPGRHELATTQDHYPITEIAEKEKAKRIGKLVVEADIEEYRKHPDFARHAVHRPEPAPLWKEHEYGPYRWGMAIDLNACVGCGACVMACQAENNIPVVGREQVLRHRAMHWLRVDRYFKGSPDSPTVAFQPVTCMHCENAPCEQVCPVAATVHDKEGLNVMVYNRCVGTRYCSNNCPFKVRRFNFFNYRLNLSETEKMAMNPEVTVRSRGVMEKCTYCVQRIMAAKVRAKNDRRPIRDGEIVPACAQACPTMAIVFGDLNDKDSAVSRLQAGGRAYGLLPDLNLKTRTVYLARIRNPRPEEAKGKDS